eukprot:TRINITY_DN6632_c0_g1_i1.p1 TRINITY_DN6632_c0_g1~~TRINITY_DN6632_c0_g1_i1.p1  ORF type:complete len:303 (-),score=28.44 TRINITY_DN6632_c0_g1_i1:16-924(-)
MYFPLLCQDLLPLGTDDSVCLWYSFLVAITVINFAMFMKSSTKNLRPDMRRYQITLRVLSGVYVAGCGFRSVFPRIDVEKVCLFDSWTSSILLGRTAATFAELSFMAQLCLVLNRVASDIGLYSRASGISIITNFAKLSFVLNVAAQTFCWLGISTTYQLWHVYEESIWAFTALGMTASCFYLKNKLHENEKNVDMKDPCVQDLRNFLRYFVILGPAYILYMVFVDVPMYYRRWTEDEENGRTYYSVWAGLKEANSCKFVNGKYSYWAEDAVWMAGYFSVAVWISIWLMRAPRIPPNSKKVQ